MRHKLAACDVVLVVEKIREILTMVSVWHAGSAFDHIETALSKFEDGPFFLGQFSQVILKLSSTSE